MKPWTWWRSVSGKRVSEPLMRTRDGETLMQTTAVAHLGGATLDIEENYLIKKLLHGRAGDGRASAIRPGI